MIRTYTHYECPCGYRLTVKLIENDQPYSSSYEQEETMVGDYRTVHAGMQTTFTNHGKRCPACGC